MEYFVVKSTWSEEFSKTVSNRLQNGWTLYGNLVVTVSDKGIRTYYQSLTRNNPTPLS